MTRILATNIYEQTEAGGTSSIIMPPSVVFPSRSWRAWSGELELMAAASLCVGIWVFLDPGGGVLQSQQSRTILRCSLSL